MKYPTVRYIHDRRKNGKGYIEVEITYANKRKWLSTGVAVSPKQWNDSRGIVNHPNNAELNLRINAVKGQIDSFIRNLMAKGKPFTWEDLNAMLERHNNSESFVAFVERRIEEQHDICERTKKAHRKLVAALNRFGKIQSFDSLTRPNVLLYDDWLHTQNYAQPTIHTYHKLLKRYINEALSRELIEKDPYIGMRIERGHSKARKYLTEDEIKQLRECELNLPTLERVRDLFIFQCYTGLAYADLSKFDFTNVVQRNGRYVVQDTRQKSGEDFYIVLLSPALEILRKYNFELPSISNQQYNLRLKVVADKAGMDKKLTTHMARHSFACFALNAGMPIEVVSKALGHTNINTTQVYAKLLNSTLEREFDKLEGHI